jgi:hypothetical protein
VILHCDAAYSFGLVFWFFFSLQFFIPSNSKVGKTESVHVSFAMRPGGNSGLLDSDSLWGSDVADLNDVVQVVAHCHEQVEK